MSVDIGAAIQGVVDALGALELDGSPLSASTDPAQVNVPGVIVQFVQLQPATLNQRELQLRLLLVVPDSDGGPGPAAALSDLLAVVETYASADGPITALPVLMPDGAAPVPGLAFPLNIYAQEGAPA